MNMNEFAAEALATGAAAFDLSCSIRGSNLLFESPPLLLWVESAEVYQGPEVLPFLVRVRE